MLKFLCDHMCVKLGRWLRAAGYDTSIIEDSSDDQEIFQKAVQEDRFLLTKDKHFKEIDPKGRTLIYLRGQTLDEWAQQLKEEKELNWLYRPFSRCLKCNGLLEKTTAAAAAPPRIQETVQDFWACKSCGQLFWAGSHTDRMLEKLKEWQD